jgi:hypothetical protein
LCDFRELSNASKNTARLIYTVDGATSQQGST